ncbi:MAG: redoxin family protein [Epsilonproteobacteria bacterium]|nr:redoxin family protein [Campylobacterota bacterium]
MQITVHGQPVTLLGKEKKVGAEAPAAKVKTIQGKQDVIGMIAPTAQLLIAIPSLKTEVCSLGAKKFNDLIAEFKKLKTIMITTDDETFVTDFIEREKIDNAEIVIDQERQFAKKYGLLISEGKLKDRLARAVFLVDGEGVIAYKELVSEIVDEVDYDACIQAVQNLLSEKKKGHTHENWMSV